MSGKIAFRCSKCDKLHEGLPALAFDAPWYYYTLAERDRAKKAELTSDTCVIERRHFFVRAVLEIPIVGERERLEWGVWGSLSEDNFERYTDPCAHSNQSRLGPLFSWFASRLPGYPDTSALRCNLIPGDGRLRPLVDFRPDEDHPLAVDKKRGIHLDRAIELVMPVLHKH
jgi:hypothetical protein